jgi:hypothetical protein
MTGGDAEDEHWRRPDPDAADGGSADPQQYAGPPTAPPPPADWRPPTAAVPAQPRRLPVLDDQAIDREEQRAEYVTYAIGVGAGVIVLVIALVRHLS